MQTETHASKYYMHVGMQFNKSRGSKKNKEVAMNDVKGR